MTVEELKKRAEIYFKNGEKKMYATEDGNLWYEHDKAYGEAHARRIKKKLVVLEKEEVIIYSEDELKSMTIAKLKSIATDSKSTKKDDLILDILTAQDVTDTKE